ASTTQRRKQNKSAAPSATMESLELRLVGLDGHELCLEVPEDISGKELLQLVRSQLPAKPGARLHLIFGDVELRPEHSLRAQGLGPSAFGTFTYSRADLRKAWNLLTGHDQAEAEDDLKHGQPQQLLHCCLLPKGW
ncbi:unnamed protein product, partial [Effrenium voratum]